MIQKVLITGVTGSGGSYLAEYILKNVKGIEVVGTTRDHSSNRNIQDIKDKLTLRYLDLNDSLSVYRLIEETMPDTIFHIASIANVRKSFDYPHEVITNNINITLNLLEAIRLVKNKNGYNPTIQICCHDEQTELLTKRGFLKYHEIQNNDLVVSIDPQTKEIRYNPIKKIIVSDYSGEMKRISTRSIDSLITPNHTLLVSKHPGTTLEFKSVHEIPNTTTRYYLPKGKKKGVKNTSIKIGEVEYSTKDIFYLCGLHIGDGYAKTQVRFSENKSGLSRSEFIEKSRNSDGTFHGGKQGTKNHCETHSHRCFIYIPENDKSRTRVKECLIRLGFKFSSNKDGFYFSSKDFVNFFEQFGTSADTKTIPEWMFDYDSEYLDFLYKGLIDSDGYYYGSGERFSTVSKSLVLQFTKLCLFTGRFVTFSTTNPNKEVKINGRIIRSNHTPHVFSISSKERLFTGRHISTQHYTGKIWCLEIENDHNFVVKRNNRICVSGNSTSEVYGKVDPKDVPITENCPLKPINPYAISKLTQDSMGYVYFLNYGMKVIRTRMFSYLNAKRADLFATAMAKQILEIKQGKRDVLEHGNLNSIRSFIDVREAAESYWVAAIRGEPGEVYNIGGSEPIRLSDLLSKLIDKMGGSITTRQNRDLLRPSDVSIQIPNMTKFTAQTGWSPKITFDKNLDFFIEEIYRIWSE